MSETHQHKWEWVYEDHRGSSGLLEGARCACGDYYWLDSILEDLNKQGEVIATTKQETLDEVINTLCGLCAGGTPLHHREGTWAHLWNDGTWVVCRAAEIRDLVDGETE